MPHLRDAMYRSSWSGVLLSLQCGMPISTVALSLGATSSLCWPMLNGTRSRHGFPVRNTELLLAALMMVSADVQDGIQAFARRCTRELVELLPAVPVADAKARSDFCQ